MAEIDVMLKKDDIAINRNLARTGRATPAAGDWTSSSRGAHLGSASPLSVRVHAQEVRLMDSGLRLEYSVAKCVLTSHVCQQLQVTDGLVPRQRANGPDRDQRVNDLDAGWAIPPATQSCGAAHRCICQRQPAEARMREPGAIVQRRRCPRVCRRLLVAGASRPRTGMPLVCDVALLAESGFNFVTIFLALSGFTLVTMSSPQDEHFGRAVEHRRPLPTAARAPSDHHPPSSTLSRVSQA